MRRDAIFYTIFQRFPSLLFELIDDRPPDAQRYRFESVEVKEPTFRIDGVFLPPEDADSKVVFFAEVQFQKDESLYHRFFSESLLYLYRNQALYDDWYGVIIFPSRSLEPTNTTIHRSLLSGSQATRIYLDELDDRETQPIGINLMQLTIAPESEAIAQAREIIDRVQQETDPLLDRNEIIELVSTIVVYKLVNLSREEVELMLNLTPFHETRIYKELQHETNLKVIRNLLIRGQGIEYIAEIVELPTEEVERIIREEL
jgi:predicted transposase/invertase (TIGR01784 family)